MRRTLLLLAVVLAGAVSTASAQADLRVEISVDPATRNPRPRLRNLMNDQRWREAIDDAFRISLNWQVDLYRTRALWLPSREAQFEQRKLWDAMVAEAATKLKAQGVQFVQADKKAFYEATQPIRDKYGSKYAALLKRIQETA